MMSALHSTSRLLLHFVSERQEARLAHIIIQHPPAMPHGRVEALMSLLMARCLFIIIIIIIIITLLTSRGGN